MFCLKILNRRLTKLLIGTESCVCHEQISSKKNNEYVGKAVEVMIFKKNKYGKPLGMTRTIKPVIVESAAAPEEGQFLMVRIVSATTASLVGEPC